MTRWIVTLRQWGAAPLAVTVEARTADEARDLIIGIIDPYLVRIVSVEQA